MQAISGSVSLSLTSKEAGGTSDLSSEADSDMASGLGFLALFTTQVEPATADLKLSDLIKKQLAGESLDGKLFPQGLPLRSSFTELLSGIGKQQLSGSNLFPAQGLMDALQGESDVDSFQSLIQDPGSSVSRTKGSLPGTASFAAITAQVGNQGWGDELVSRVKWQIGQEIQEVKISLNPRELGPLQVKINIIDDRAHVQFVTHHGSVRDAIEDALPRLREMLEQTGMMLADADVSQQDPDRQQTFFETVESTQGSDNAAEPEDPEQQPVKVIRQGVGLVDAFI